MRCHNGFMTTAEFIEALQNDLREIAALGDDTIAEAGDRLITALRSSASLRLLDLLGEAALEVSGQLPSGHVEMRMSGQDAELLYVPDTEPAGAGPAVSGDDGSARITLRLSESLKTSVEAAASAEGLSVNTWIVRALSRATTDNTVQRTAKRITGFIQA